MKFNLTNKKLLTINLIIGLILIIITEPVFFFIHKGIFNDYEKALLEPIFFWAIALFVCSVILLFFSKRIFDL